MRQRMRPEAIIFDMGGTLEEISRIKEVEMNGASMMISLLDREGVLLEQVEGDAFLGMIEQGLERYKQWSMHNGYPELQPENVWSTWILASKGFNTERISADIGERLSFLYETQCLKRTLRADALNVLEQLSKEGYLLGVISNSTSRTQVPYTLKLNDLESLFPVVEISCVAGYRKPSPVMFLNAARRLGVSPEACIYVGDTFTRDVVGARASGYGYVLWMQTREGQRPAEYASHQESLNKSNTSPTWEEKISSISDVYAFVTRLANYRKTI
jgi:putative hydrolase of the HAD superfamily